MWISIYILFSFVKYYIMAQHKTDFNYHGLILSGRQHCCVSVSKAQFSLQYYKYNTLLTQIDFLVI